MLCRKQFKCPKTPPTTTNPASRIIIAHHPGEHSLDSRNEGGGVDWVPNMLARLLICVALLLVVEAATVTAYCGLLFGCGCTLVDGMAYCNVHNLQGPWCPWCSQGKLGFYVPFAGMTAGAIAGAWWGLMLRSRLWAGLLAGMAGYLAAGAVAAWISARIQGYPL